MQKINKDNLKSDKAKDFCNYLDSYNTDRNISVGYDLLDEPMDQDEFLEQVTSAYVDAEKRGFDSIIVAIDTDLDTTYYINDTPDGFQCDLWDYYFDDLETIASQLYNEMHGSVTEIRIE